MIDEQCEDGKIVCRIIAVGVQCKGAIADTDAERLEQQVQVASDQLRSQCDSRATVIGRHTAGAAVVIVDNKEFDSPNAFGVDVAKVDPDGDHGFDK